MNKTKKFLVWVSEYQAYPFKIMASTAEEAVAKLHVFLHMIVIPFKVELAADQSVWL